MNVGLNWKTKGPKMQQSENTQNVADDGVDDLDEVSEVIPSNFAITSYGADYPVDALVKRMATGAADEADVIVPRFNMDVDNDESVVGFQRGFVWKKGQSDRFIESLLLGLPVPGIFLVKEASGKLLVLDGQQRLLTLMDYYRGVFRGVEYKLDNVQDRWKGKTYKDLDVGDRRRLDDSIIHATIVRQDEPEEGQTSVYLIFERLNSGGTILQPQEIRVALYHGKFAKLLGKLNEIGAWRHIYGKASPRLKDIELILRFFALYYYHNDYSSPMKGFLNKYMSTNKDLQKQDEVQLRSIFEPIVEQVNRALGKKAFRPARALNAAVFDSVMVALATRIASGKPIDDAGIVSAYDGLLSDAAYRDATTHATANEDTVRFRLTSAMRAFE